MPKLNNLINKLLLISFVVCIAWLLGVIDWLTSYSLERARNPKEISFPINSSREAVGFANQQGFFRNEAFLKQESRYQPKQWRVRVKSIKPGSYEKIFRWQLENDNISKYQYEKAVKKYNDLGTYWRVTIYSRSMLSFRCHYNFKEDGELITGVIYDGCKFDK